MKTADADFAKINVDLVLQKGRAFLFLLASSFRAHAVFFVLIGVYLAGLEIVKRKAGINGELGPFWMLRSFVGFIVPTTLLSIVIMRFLHMIYYVRPKTSPTIYLLKDVWQFLSNPKRLINAIPMIFILIYFILCFSTIKDAVPLVHPFAWDTTLMKLDRAVHFGTDPWRLLHPILGYAPITFLLNIVYNVWFVVIWMAWVWFAFASEQSELRLQYLLSYFLSWSIGGSLLAIVFSSAGPVYYGNLDLGSNPYAELISYLRATSEVIPLWAVNTQDLLWQAYLNNNEGMISGISAMPSMHNTAAFTIALVGWRINRKVGIAGSLFAFAIFLGSIHLGWHYAVDAYAGFAVAGTCWWVSGRFARWYMNLSFVKSHKEELQAL